MKTLRALTAAVLLGATVAAAPSVSTDLASSSAASEEQAGDLMGAGYFEQVFFPSLDGTRLHADVLLPAPPDEAPPGGWPVIISIGPYFSPSTQGDFVVGTPFDERPVPRFADFIEGAEIFANGYAWAQIDSRGYGASEGCNDFGGIGEQMDVAASVEYFGNAPWSNGNVGTYGKSYDAWTQVMGLAMNPTHLKAAVIQAPLIEGYSIGWDNGIHWDSGWYATPSLYMLYDLTPLHVGATPEEHLNTVNGAGQCWPENQAFAAAGFDHGLPYWQERDLIPRAQDSEVAVLWAHGMNDVNTKPNNILPVWDDLPGYHRGWFGQWDHKRGNEVQHTGRDGFLTEVMDFYDHFLKGEEFDLDISEDSLSRIQTQKGNWYLGEDWPRPDMQRFTLDLLPGSYVDDTRATDSSPSYGTWTFSDAAPYDVHLSGAPTITVDVTTQVPNANMLVKVYDVDEDGYAELISRGAQLLTSSGEFTFDSFPAEWQLAAGHRIGVLLTSQDAEHTPINTRSTVTVNGGSVALPFLTLPVEYDLTDAPASVHSEIASASTSLFERESAFAWPPQVD